MIPKQKLKVSNWATHSESLRRRGDLTVWISDEAISQWLAQRRKSRGGQPKYSDLAITMCLALRVVYDQPLRQTHVMTKALGKVPANQNLIPATQHTGGSIPFPFKS